MLRVAGAGCAIDHRDRFIGSIDLAPVRHRPIVYFNQLLARQIPHAVLDIGTHDQRERDRDQYVIGEIDEIMRGGCFGIVFFEIPRKSDVRITGFDILDPLAGIAGVHGCLRMIDDYRT